MKRQQIIGAITLLVAVLVYWQQSQTQQQPTSEKHHLPAQLSSFVDVIEARKSEEWMTVSVRVVKILPDDNEGSRHQRFLVEGRDGNTVLIAHNIDLAKSVPIQRRDLLEIRGRYEWNDKGGVLHWTHRDSSGRHSGGWIRHRGIKYR